MCLRRCGLCAPAKTAWAAQRATRARTRARVLSAGVATAHQTLSAARHPRRSQTARMAALTGSCRGVCCSQLRLGVGVVVPRGSMRPPSMHPSRGPPAPQGAQTAVRGPVQLPGCAARGHTPRAGGGHGRAAPAVRTRGAGGRASSGGGEVAGLAQPAPAHASPSTHV